MISWRYTKIFAAHDAKVGINVGSDDCRLFKFWSSEGIWPIPAQQQNWFLLQSPRIVAQDTERARCSVMTRRKEVGSWVEQTLYAKLKGKRSCCQKDQRKKVQRKPNSSAENIQRSPGKSASSSKQVRKIEIRRRLARTFFKAGACLWVSFKEEKISNVPTPL